MARQKALQLPPEEEIDPHQQDRRHAGKRSTLSPRLQRPESDTNRGVPRLPFPPDIDELLRRPNPAVVATVRPDGSPHSVATWYLWDGSRVLLNMDESRARLAFLRGEPRLSLTVLDTESWYRQVNLDGRVAELVDDTELEDIDRLARHYTGRPFRDRESRRVSAWVEVERWHVW
jgi:PPOX class probable F420-dependent enzyme